MNATESGAFSKPSLFHGVKRFQLGRPFPDFTHLRFCEGFFQKVMSQQKRKASHPRIKQYF